MGIVDCLAPWDRPEGVGFGVELESFRWTAKVRPFEVGLKEEKKIIRQVKWNKFEEQDIWPYCVIVYLGIEWEYVCVFPKIKTMGDELDDFDKLRDRSMLFTEAKFSLEQIVILIYKIIQSMGYNSL